MRKIPRHLPIALYVGISLLPGKNAEARWSQRDALRIDRYERLGAEYYNDVLSYRFQEAWWLDRGDKAFSYMASMGSLNQKDFYYEEYIRLRSPDNPAWQLAFQRDRTETPIRKQESSLLGLSYQPEGGNVRMGPLVEAETEKAFVDIGWYTGFSLGNRIKTEAWIWAIDPLFSQKKPIPGDRRTGQPWYYRWDLDYESETWKGSLSAMREGRVSWYQSEYERHYEFSRSMARARIAHVNADREIFATATSTAQEESFRYATAAANEDGIDYRETEWETGYRWDQKSVSVWAHQNRTHFLGFDEQFPVLFPGLATQRRREYALLASWTSALRDSTQHRQHQGLIFNQARIEDDHTRNRTEGKYLWAFDFRLNPQSRILLGTTWDLDHLVKAEGAEKLKKFWGGGYGQVLLAF